jgi:parallel beta-helix repeat protein
MGKAGDTILFMGGKVYAGKLQPRTGITYNGNGAILTDIVYCYHVSNVVLWQFVITDPTMNPLDHGQLAKIEDGIVLDGCTNCTVRNCDISLVGVGVDILSDGNKVINCTIHNLRMVVNDNTNPYNDYGANGIVISSNGNTITGCKIYDCYAPSYDYGTDGGAIEFYGTTNNNVVTNDSCINNCGFIEFGSSGTGTSNNDSIANNFLQNNNRIFWVNNSGQFTIKVSGLKFWNNTVVENLAQAWNEKYLIGCATSSTTIIMDLQRNILYYTIPTQLSRGVAFTHSNNFGLDVLTLSTDYKLQIGKK